MCTDCEKLLNYRKEHKIVDEGVEFKEISKKKRKKKKKHKKSKKAKSSY